MPANYHYYLYLTYLSFFSALIPLITGFSRKKYFQKSELVLFYLTVISLLTDTIIFVLRNNHLNNLFFLRVFTLIQFVLLSIFFSKTLLPSKITPFIKVFIFVFFGIAAVDLYINGLGHTDDLSSTVSSIILMIYSLFTFYHIMENQVHANIFSDPVFWFNTAILIYFSGSLFLFIFNNYILKHSYKIHYELWSVNSILSIIFNVLIAIGFWKTKSRQK